MQRRLRIGLLHLAVLGGVALAGHEAVAQQWIDRRQEGPFICHADFSLAGYEKLLGELIPLEKDVREVLQLRPCTKPIQVLIFSDQKVHKKYLATYYSELPYRRAMYVQKNGEATVLVYRHKEIDIDLRHECTHALLHADLPMVPLWLDEGIAEYFEVEAKNRSRKHPHLKALRPNGLFQRFMTMHELEGKKKLEKLTANDYRQSWAWAHFMLEGPAEARRELNAYLNDIRRHHIPGSLADRIENAVPNSPLRMSQHIRTYKQK